MGHSETPIKGQRYAVLSEHRRGDNIVTHKKSGGLFSPQKKNLTKPNIRAIVRVLKKRGIPKL